MKLISTTLGRLIVAVAAVILVFVFVSSSFLPAIQDFYNKVFPNEKNYISDNIAEPSIRFIKERFVFSVGASVDSSIIFDNLITSDQESRDFVELLKSDYAKPLNERAYVFVYKVLDDGTLTLSDTMDSSTTGCWTVLLIIEDGSGQSVVTTNYVFV